MLRVLVPLVGSLVVIEAVPGASLVAVVVASVRDRRSGLWTAVGVSTGDVLWAAAALAGVGAVLQQSRPAFLVSRWLGAAYLLLFALRLARREVGHEADGVPAPSGARGRRARSFLNGLLVDLANPKAALFFTSLYISVVPPHLGVWAAGVVLLTTAVVVYGWHLLVALLVSHSPTPRLPRRARRAVKGAAAAAVAGLGLRLALSE